MTPLRRFSVFLIAASLCLVPALSAAEPVSGGASTTGYTTLVKPNGTIWVWGYTLKLPTSVSASVTVTAVASGGDHVLLLASDGTVWSWGSNQNGEVGDGSTTSRSTAVQAYGLSNIVAIAAGLEHSLALDSSGHVWAWGLNSEGQLGIGSTTSTAWPTQVGSFSNVTTIAAGWYHTLAVKSDGSVYSWGYNNSGQLGDGSTTRRTSPTSITSITDATAVAGGGDFSLILRSGGTVKASGGNGLGQLGDGTGSGSSSPVTVSSLTGVAKIAAGTSHALAIQTDGDVYAWGSNSVGQIGDGTTTNRLSPVEITGLTSVVEYVTGGSNHSNAIDEDGVVYSWGGNESGQIGDGTNVARQVPTPISGPDYEWKVGTPYFNYSSGTFSSTITVSITAFTSGATIRYTTDGSEPTESSSSIASGGTINISQTTTLKAKAYKSGVPASNTAVAVYTFVVQTPQFSPGTGTYTSAQNITISSSTSGAAFRYTTDGSTPTESSTLYSSPVSIGTYTVLKAIATKSGWSNSSVGSATYTMNFGSAAAPTMSPSPGTFTSSVEVTLATTTSGATIVYTTNGSTPTETSTAYTAPLTLTATTTLKARAYRVDYAASDVTTGTYTIAAAAPSFSPTAGAYSAGQAITVSTATSGATIRYTTDGTEPTESSATVVSGSTLIVGNFTLKAKSFKSGTTASSVTSAAYTTTSSLGQRIAAGGSHSLAIAEDGQAWSWGRNTYGQLGDGTTTGRTSPVRILGSTGFVDVDGGAEHSVAVRSDGAVYTFGTIPTLVSTLSSGGAKVAAGTAHSLAMKTDGTVVAWGTNSSGQLGDGTTTDRTTPVAVSSLTGVIAVAAGANFSVALKGDGTIWTWGANGDGQLGDGTTTQRTSPVQVSGITTAVAITAGDNFAAAILSNGTAKSWGINSQGQLGNGTGTSSSTPVSVNGITTATAAAAGTFHLLILNSDGSVRAFGYNSYGQLGDGTSTDRPWGTTPIGLPAVEQIAAGTSHSLAITSAGEVWVWGQNTYGQLGDRTNTHRSQPVAISTADMSWSLPAPIFDTQSGLYSTALNVTVTSPDPSATIRYTTDGTDPISTSSTVTSGNTVSIDATKTLKASAWLTGSPTSYVTTATYTLKAVTPVLSPSTGGYGSAQSVSMSTTTSGATIRYTADGSEPTSSSTAYSSAITVSSTQTVKAVAFKTGWTASDSGFASYWISSGTTAAPTFSPSAGTFTSAPLVSIATTTTGASIRYTLDGSTPSATSPLYVYPFVVDATTTVKAMAFKAGYTASSVTSGTFSVDATGAAATPAVSPGGGFYTTNQTVTITGESGATLRYTTDGTTPDESDTAITSGNTITIDRSTVLKVRAWKSGVTESVVRRADYVITGVIAAGEYHSVALKSNGSVWAWGRAGGIGDGTSSDQLSPVQVLTGAVGIAAGTDRSIAVKSDGSVWTWAGTTPAQVTATGFTNLIAVAAGNGHYLALKSDGTVWSWGANTYGQLGDGTTTTQSSPTQVTGLSGVTAIAAGSHASYAIGSDGASTGVIWAWGRNDVGQLGDGSTLIRMRPVIVGGLASVRAIAGGGDFAIAVKSDGTVWSFGSNADGALGVPSPTSSATPVRVDTLAGVVRIAAGLEHAMALDARGRVWAWGQNNNKQLGNVNYLPAGPAWFPQLVPNLSASMAIAAGGPHSLAVKADGSAWSWGAGKGLGDGVGTQSDVPVDVSDLVLTTNSLLSADTDSDGLIGWLEYLGGSDPLNADTNGNGISDGVETHHGATDADNPDTDGDGMANWLEVQAGTDPFNTDSDGDTVVDGSDAFPLDPTRSSAPTGNPSDTTPPVITLTEPTNATLVP